MIVKKSTVEKMVISEVPGLDPVTAILEDFGPGQGQITISCYGESWTAYWGGMGNDCKIAQFLTGCDEHYLNGKLGIVRDDVIDDEKLTIMLKENIISIRRAGDLGSDEARELFDQIERIDFDRDLWVEADFMQKVIGDDWHCALPTKEHHRSVYLRRIIRTVQDALKESAC